MTNTWNVQFKHYVLNIFTGLAKMNTIEWCMMECSRRWWQRQSSETGSGFEWLWQTTNQFICLKTPGYSFELWAVPGVIYSSFFDIFLVKSEAVKLESFGFDSGQSTNQLKYSYSYILFQYFILMFDNQLCTRIPNSSSSSSVTINTDGDISETKRAIRDPLVSKRPEKI